MKDGPRILASMINLITALFTELHEERESLLEIERKMVISERGQVFRTELYRTALWRVAGRLVSYSVSAFVGASILYAPLLLVSQIPLLGLVVPLTALFVLGFYLGRDVAANPVIWGLSMVVAGGLVTLVGLLFPA